jgi:hydrogenase expression/formation protein HypD
MKYVDEFRDATAARGLVAQLHTAARALPRLVRIMEICGGHTVAICRNGLHAVLPPTVRLVSGPGCPVCVTPGSLIDAAIWLAEQPGVQVFTFGDMLRVPGSRTTLADANARTHAVQMIYSPLQAVQYARDHADQRCVLLGVGFETTAPMLAAAVAQAAELGLPNFYFLSAGKMTPPVMRALLHDATVALDAFIAPGHVTTIIGANAYQFIADDYGKPCVVAGFEVCDILDALVRTVRQLAGGAHTVDIEYTRSVTRAGNAKAQALLAQVFTPCDTVWRGLGMVPRSGYALQPAYARLDALHAFAAPAFPEQEPAGCRCGAVLRGVCLPYECGLFGTACTPTRPVGPCMVSSEGSCGAYFRFGVRAPA